MSLDANKEGEVTIPVDVAGGSTITMYIKQKSGDKGKYRVCLQLSPDNGTSWFTAGIALHNDDFTTVNCAATHARACVDVPQGSASTVDITILAV